MRDPLLSTPLARCLRDRDAAEAEVSRLSGRVTELEQALTEILAVSDGMGGTKYDWEADICARARAALAGSAGQEQA